MIPWVLRHRTTSAHAENTCAAALGEYAGMELPPRTRRIRRSSLGAVAVFGTTSACAENTSDRWDQRTRPWNYLRVRGEYLSRTVLRVATAELPPRARRIPSVTSFKDWSIGTTSACAENTFPPHLSQHHRRNYLRVRGEY